MQRSFVGSRSPSFNEKRSFAKMRRLVGLVGAVSVEDGKIARAGFAWFGMGPTPIRAKAAEQMLLGQLPAGINPQAVAERAIADTAPFDDHHASAEYRRIVGRRIFARTLREALKMDVAQ